MARFLAAISKYFSRKLGAKRQIFLSVCPGSRNRLADEMFEQMLVAKLNDERYDKVNSYFLGTVTEAYLSEVFC